MDGETDRWINGWIDAQTNRYRSTLQAPVSRLEQVRKQYFTPIKKKTAQFQKHISEQNALHLAQ
jgi:hypothetical protein